MMLCKHPLDEYTLGVRIKIYPHKGDKYEVKIHSLDEYRKELEIGLPESASARWVEGIGFVFRTLWISNLHCVIAIDHDMWCQYMAPLDLKKLERSLPESHFVLRVYGVPEKSPLRQNGGEISEIVQKAYRKKRGYVTT